MGVEDRDAVAGANVFDRPIGERGRLAVTRFAEHPGMRKPPRVDDRHEMGEIGIGEL